MSHPHPTPTSSNNFQLIFNNALKAYEKRTRHDLLAHPLVAQLQACDSPSTILAVLQQQVQDLSQCRATDERWTQWLDPTVNVLYALSGTLGGGVSLVFSPAAVIFAGVGVLLQAAKDVRASQDTLIDIFERIESFFRRLEIYTEVPPTMEMMDVIIQIMVEVLCILAIVTKEIKQSRTRKYLKRVVGKTDMEDALKRLDKLTQEEARMATAQILKATHTVDDRVAGVDDRVKGVDARVANIDNRVREVDDRIVEVLDDGKRAGVLVQQATNDVDQLRRHQLRESIHRWLSPADPSTNHNIACSTHHKKTATWFFQGSIFKEWISTGSLLWIHGKPGSGKSVLCSTIIQDIETMCEAGQASMSYFYFDFRNANKQRLHDLIPSLLTQLSARSGPRCDILSSLYETHDAGKRQPSDEVLTQCLKDMLTLPDELPVYLVIDALDECHNASGIPSPRERVLQLLNELVDLRLPNLHICVTSRPEFDIRHVIEPLTSLRISLHDQSGQKKDIVDYVRSVVYSNSESVMRRWRTEDKDLVIETISERADGMFRWVFCQLEILRHCLPPSVRRTLDELPESLDETYERILKEIKKPNSEHAQRLLQCLVVAIRPLRVDELAEVLAVDFDDGEEIPKLKASWRWEDQEQALLSSCSSLIAIVDDGISRVVQFSHFSVKEFLVSRRLSTSSEDVSRYHVALKPAHTTLAQACMSVLLRSDDLPQQNGVGNSSPLARYAAEHWVAHAQFENVSSRLRKAMEDLFDLDKPYFAAWLQSYDIDTSGLAPSLDSVFASYRNTGAGPLYYAALCGFQDLVEHLIVKYPQDVNASGGYYLTPAVAALAKRQFQLAELLHRNGSSVDPPGLARQTPLYSAAYCGDLEMVRVLLEWGADANFQNKYGTTPLHSALSGVPERPKDPKIFQLLLEYGANPNAGTFERTPLHFASLFRSPEVVCLLLEHGADIEAEDDRGRNAYQIASGAGRYEVMKLLSEYGASGLS